MRRIYESDALKRDETEPLTPRERERQEQPQTFRSIESSAWSDRLLPNRIRRGSVSIRLATPDRTFEQGSSIPFEITMKNSLPIPVSIETRSPLLWTWTVDGHVEASHVSLRDPPDRTGKLYLDRGERKTIRRNWSGMFRISEREWEPADPGEHTIRAQINVENPEQSNLRDETTVRIS